MISLQIDGDMSPAQVVEAERHVAACSRCAALYADLRIVVSEASQLPLFEPDDRVWGRLRAECKAEGLIHPPESSSGAWRSWFPVPNWRLATATATLVVMISLASVWVYRGLRVAPTNSTFNTAQEMQVTSEVRMAEENYLQAINSLQAISQARMAQMDPSVKSVLEDNLATIDYYIDKCHETVINEPSNALAQRYLLEAYRKKVDLLASIVHSNVL